MFRAKWLLTAAVLLMVAGQQGVDGRTPLKLVNNGLSFIKYLMKNVNSKKIDVGHDPFCYCTSMYEPCEYFVIHSSKLLNCGLFKRLCCKSNALEQMVKRRENGTEYNAPRLPYPLMRHAGYIKVPEITTDEAVAAMKECVCTPFYSECQVPIVKPVFWSNPFTCGFGYHFCCKHSFIEHLLVPTIERHANITKGIMSDKYNPRLGHSHDHTTSSSNYDEDSDGNWTMKTEKWTHNTADGNWTVNKVSEDWTKKNINEDWARKTIDEDLTLITEDKKLTLETVHEDWSVKTVHENWTLKTTEGNLTLDTKDGLWTTEVKYGEWAMETEDGNWTLETMNTDLTLKSMYGLLTQNITDKDWRLKTMYGDWTQKTVEKYLTLSTVFEDWIHKLVYEFWTMKTEEENSTLQTFDGNVTQKSVDEGWTPRVVPFSFYTIEDTPTQPEHTTTPPKKSVHDFVQRYFASMTAGNQTGAAKRFVEKWIRL